MPYGLRIKFPGGSPQAPRTLLAARGAFALTGRAAGGNTYIPPTVDDQWVKLSTSAVQGESPLLNNGWWSGCAITTTGEFFIAHEQRGGGATGGAWFFSPATGRWRQSNTNTTEWWKAIGFRENYDCTYDPVRNCVWISSGGPVGWGNAGGPVYGTMKYDIGSDTFYNQYPSPDGTYAPTAIDAAYFISANKGLGIPPGGITTAYTYYNDNLYCIGGWTVGTYQSFYRLNLTTNARTTLTAYGATTMPPFNYTDGRYTVNRGGFDTRNKRFWVFADDGELYVYELSATPPTWVRWITTGSKPATLPPAGESGTTTGVMYALDESSNQMMAWCGEAGLTASSGTYRQTWVLDMTTLVWRNGPSAAGGDVVPRAGYGVQYATDYDPIGRRVLMAYAPGAEYITEVWSFKAGVTYPGQFTAFALPTRIGTTYGVNYAYFPFTYNGQSKQVNMCYCPTNNRLYASGGDIQPDGSNTEGIWSMDMETGSWRKDSGILDSGGALWPYPQPTGYQDGTAFYWMPSRSKFLFGMQCGESYLEVNDTRPNWVYARGVWTFDPSLYPYEGAWTQSLALTEDSKGTIDWATVHERPQTGCQFGGHYDPITDTVWVFPDAQAGGLAPMNKYHIGTWTKSSTATFRLPYHSTGQTSSAYFRASGPIAIGREVYAVGYLTNGVTLEWKLLRYHMDQELLVKFYNVPYFAPRTVQLTGIKLEVSGDNIVFFNKGFPEADVRNIFIFDTVAETWTEDTHRPAFATLLGNSTHSLPDGRIAMCGATSQPTGIVTHMFFYKVN